MANAYLLCRITDTIEDEPELLPATKRAFWGRFPEVVAGRGDAESFGRDLSTALSGATPPAERELAANTARVVGITAGRGARERAAIGRCVTTMSEGMVGFQDESPSAGRSAGPAAGLEDMEQLDRYCYVVAGVVGEMLVELFAAYSPAIDRRRPELLALAPSHAQGLQLTNILKDVWEDRRRGVCWLPRDVFAGAGFDLAELAPGAENPGFADGMAQLVGTTRGHLANALRFVQLVPSREAGIRRHLLWGLGLAVLALRGLHASRAFRCGGGVEVSRRRVAAMMLLTSALARRNAGLELIFRTATRGLPGA